jgi:acyl-coenzyme A synthetase/AMP-(fatty) acid ligase
MKNKQIGWGTGMSENLVAIFYERQRGFEAKPALIWQGAPVCTFGELPATVGRYKAALAQLGVQRGDRVMVKTENSPAFVFTYLAILASGAIFVPLNAAYTAAEVQAPISRSNPMAAARFPRSPRLSSLICRSKSWRRPIWPPSCLPRAPPAGPRARC